MSNPTDLSFSSRKSQHSTMHFFQGANNVAIGGDASFMQIGGDYHVDGRTDFDAIVSILSHSAASDAAFDSAERYPPGKCHPGTREAIMKKIMDWINDPTPQAGVLWLNGPAGSGKSAIAQSIAELLWRLHRDQYGGSFFFARNAIGRSDGGKLFSTLAYQLATQFPSIRPLINDVLYADPTISTKSLDVQLRALIIDPLIRAENWPKHTPTIIVDGLDECAGSDIQIAILNLISLSIMEHAIPIRFMIASRSEYWIEDMFKSSPLAANTRTLSLYDAEDANNDIEKYFVEQFIEIQIKHKRTLSSVEKPWPPVDIIRQLVEEASGQFIYASTVVKFVGYSSDYVDPREQLAILLASGPRRAPAFSDLDTLYATILSQLPKKSIPVLRVVMGVILLHIDVKVLEIFLGLDSGEISLVLSALSPLIIITPEHDHHDKILTMFLGHLLRKSEKIRFCHLSFREFLEDESRSEQFHINVASIVDQLIKPLFALICDTLHQKAEIAHHKSSTTRIEVYRVAVNDLTTRLYICDPTTIVSLLHKLNRTVENFLSVEHNHILYSQHLIFYLDRIRKSLRSLNGAHLETGLLASIDINISSAGEKIVRNLVASGRLAAMPELICIYLTGGLYVDELKDLHLNIIPHSGLEPIQNISDVINIRCFDRSPRGSVYVYPLEPLNDFFLKGSAGNLVQWIGQATSIAYLCLVSSLSPGLKSVLGNEEERKGDLSQSDNKSIRWSLVDNYFQNVIPNSMTAILETTDAAMSLLKLLTNLSSLNTILSLPNEESLMLMDREKQTSRATYIMLWVYEILINPQARSLVANYDTSLLQKMSSTVDLLFRQYFLLNYLLKIASEIGDPHAYETTDLRHSFAMEIGPLQDGSVYNVIIIDERPRRMEWNEMVEGTRRDLLCQFHEQVFGFPEFNQPADNEEVIKRTCWYPHLATYLLIAQVQHLYALLHLERRRYSYRIKQIFRYIPQCLPYAHPTNGNLLALRALMYLSSKLTTPPWRPPSGFCCSVTAFLKKYGRSVISNQELNSIIHWLELLTEDNGLNATIAVLNESGEKRTGFGSTNRGGIRSLLRRTFGKFK